MKKYNNFVYEVLNTQNFKQEYDTIRDSLEDFWSLVQDKIEEFNEMNSRNLQEVVNFNENIRKGRKQPQPQKPQPQPQPQPAAKKVQKGATYKYTDKNKHTYNVTVIDPRPNKLGNVMVQGKPPTSKNVVKFQAPIANLN